MIDSFGGRHCKAGDGSLVGPGHGVPGMFRLQSDATDT